MPIATTGEEPGAVGAPRIETGDNGRVASGLGKIGPGAKEAMPHLTQGLREDRDKDARLAAAIALCYIGPEAKVAGAALIEALKDDALE